MHRSHTDAAVSVTPVSLAPCVGASNSLASRPSCSTLFFGLRVRTDYSNGTPPKHWNTSTGCDTHGHRYRRLRQCLQMIRYGELAHGCSDISRNVRTLGTNYRSRSLRKRDRSARRSTPLDRRNRDTPERALRGAAEPSVPSLAPSALSETVRFLFGARSYRYMLLGMTCMGALVYSGSAWKSMFLLRVEDSVSPRSLRRPRSPPRCSHGHWHSPRRTARRPLRSWG